MRRRMPKDIQQAPELLLGLDFIYNAYWELHTCRNSGWGMCSIPWSAIHSFAESHDIRGSEFHDFVYLIRSMDNTHLKWAREEAEKDKKNKRS